MSGRIKSLWMLRHHIENSAVRGALFSVFVQGQYIALQFAASVLLARLLGPGAFGEYSFAWSIITLVFVLPDAGLANLMVRFGAVYHTAQQWNLLRGLTSRIFWAAAIYGVMTATVVVLIASSGLFPTVGAASPRALSAAALPLLLLPLVAVLGATIRVLHPGVIGQLPEFMVRPLTFVGLVVLIVCLDVASLSPQVALACQGLAALFACGVGWSWVVKYRPVTSQATPPTYEAGRWLKVSLPFALTAGFMVINTQADILMLGILTTAHVTGVYRVASRSASLVVLALAGANLFIEPRVVRLYNRHDFHTLQKLLIMSSRATFVLGLSVAGTFWLAGYWLLKTIFGPEYASAYPVLAVFCLGQLINVGAGSVGLVLNMTGHERDALTAAGAAAVVNIMLNLILIPHLGGMGAALATMVTTAIWNGFMVYRLWRRTGLWTAFIALGGDFSRQ